MAYKTVRLSDVTGAELKDDEVVTLTIRLDDDVKQADTTQEELKTLKTVTGLVEIEVKIAVGEGYRVYATRAELEKWIGADKLKALPGNRGRRPGYKPNGN